MARTDPQLNLRLPAELKEQLNQAAEASGRTTTAETVFRLQRSFDPMTLELPDEMRASLEADAKYAGRTLHAEILRRLSLSLTADPLALDPAQLQISIPNKLYNNIKRAAVENHTIPNEEITNRLEASFDLSQHRNDPAPAFALALRLAEAQGLFVDVLAGMCKRLLETHGPESFGLNPKTHEKAERLVAKSVRRTDYDESDINELMGIAYAVGAIVPKEWPETEAKEKPKANKKKPNS